jgi:hypothetical protein
VDDVEVAVHLQPRDLLSTKGDIMKIGREVLLYNF